MISKDPNNPKPTNSVCDIFIESDINKYMFLIIYQKI